MHAAAGRKPGERAAENAAPRDKPTCGHADQPGSGPLWSAMALAGFDLPVQAKLTVGEPDDVFEREADAVADRVMRMPESDFGGRGLASGLMRVNQGGAAQRLCPACESRPSCPAADEPVQTKAEGGAGVHLAFGAAVGRLGGGRSLDAGTRSFFEPRFGARLDNVRLHTGAAAAVAAGAVSARAFTLGHNIVLGGKAESPATPGGRRLLAHELTHVFQQGAASTLRRDMTREEEVALSRTSPGRYTGRALPPSFTVYNFAINSDALKDEHRALLSEIASLMRTYSRSVVLGLHLIGHASAPGTEELNEDLSRGRAEAARAYLAAEGVTNVTIAWRGEHAPAATNDTVAGRTRNRRVDMRLYIVGPPPPGRREEDEEGPPPDGELWFCLRHPIICALIGIGIGLLLFCLLNPAVCLPGPPPPPGTGGGRSLSPGVPRWVWFRGGYNLAAHALDARYNPQWVPGRMTHAHAYQHGTPATADASFTLTSPTSDPIPVGTLARVKENGVIRGSTLEVLKLGPLAYVMDMPLTALTFSDTVNFADYRLEWEWSNDGIRWVSLGTSGLHPLFWLYARPRTTPLYTAAVERATRYARFDTSAQAVGDDLRQGPRWFDGAGYDPGDAVDSDPLHVYSNPSGSICTDFANLLTLLARSAGLEAHPVLFYGGFSALGRNIWVSLAGTYATLINVQSPWDIFNPPPAARAPYSPLGWDFSYHAIASVAGRYQDAALDLGGPPVASAAHDGLNVYFVELTGGLPSATVGTYYAARIPRLMRRVRIVYRHFSRYITVPDILQREFLPIPLGQRSPYYTPVLWNAIEIPSLSSVGLHFDALNGMIWGMPTEPVNTTVLAATEYFAPSGRSVTDSRAYLLEISRATVTTP